MKLWLDDTRAEPDGWVRCYWPDEMYERISSEEVTHISLDHDLGDDERGTGYEVLLWLESQVVLFGLTPPIVYIHTANVAARARMHAALASVERHAAAQLETSSSGTLKRRTDTPESEAFWKGVDEQVECASRMPPAKLRELRQGDD